MPLGRNSLGRFCDDSESGSVAVMDRFYVKMKISNAYSLSK